MPFRQILKSPYQYFKNRNGIFHELKMNLRWEQWSNILIWQLFENLPKIKYFLAFVNRSIGPMIKIILSVQDNFCLTFATVRRTFGMTVLMVTSHFIWMIIYFCQVFAEGTNGKKLKSKASTIIVNLIDENDNNPTFTDTVYNYTIKKNITVGHTVGQVNPIEMFILPCL